LDYKSGGVTGSAEKTTISGLIAGVYNFTVTDATGCISLQRTVVVKDGSSTTWTIMGSVGTWSNGMPSFTTNVIIGKL
jgi:hypothetical protein